MIDKDETERSRTGILSGPATMGSQSHPPEPNPLILKFQTSHGRYAYDACTGALLRLDRVCFELLDFIQSGPICEVPASIAGRFPPDEVAESLSRLASLLSKSAVFRRVRIKSRLASPEFVAQHLERIAGTFGQLILEVSQNCNLRCRYCVFAGRHPGMRPHNNLTMSWDVARKAIDFFLKSHSRHGPNPYISFYGGEPTLNMELVRRCVEYARAQNQGVTFGITTNGTLLDIEVRRFLVAHDFALYVSLDGPRAIHDRARVFAGGGGTFDVITRNLRALRDVEPEYYAKRVVVQCTMSPGVDFSTLLDFFSNATDLIGQGTPFIGLEVAGIGESVPPEQISEAKNGLAALEERYLRKVEREERGDSEFAILRGMFEKPYLSIHRRMVSPHGWGETFHTRGTCFPGNGRLFVHADGTYFPCVKSNKALEIGDVEKGLDRPRLCAIYRAFHDLHQDECRTCWAMNLCSSCIAVDTQRTGRFEAGLDQLWCEEQREYWKDKFTKYASVLEQNPHAFEYLRAVSIIQTRVPILDDLPDMPGLVGSPHASPKA